MKIISIDIETTGTNPEKDQMLQFSAVAFDTSKPFEPKVRTCNVKHSFINGHIFAICMNAEILKQIRDGVNTVKPEDFVAWFEDWILSEELYVKKDKERYRINVVGKNAGLFDLKFLEKIPGWTEKISASHRILDVGSMLSMNTDELVPDLKECKRRAMYIYGVKFDSLEVSHLAEEDAMDVAKICYAHVNENTKTYDINTAT